MKKLGLLFRTTSENRIKNNIKESNNVFIIKYLGLSSPDLTTLRQQLKNYKAKLFVIKNSIAKRAIKNSLLEGLTQAIEGPCGLVFAKEEPVETSRVLYNFSREHGQLKLEGGILQDKVLSGEEIQRLARLPTKEVLRAQAVWALKSPITSSVMVLNQMLRKFVWCLEQIKQKRPQSTANN